MSLHGLEPLTIKVVENVLSLHPEVVDKEGEAGTHVRVIGEIFHRIFGPCLYTHMRLSVHTDPTGPHTGCSRVIGLGFCLIIFVCCY